MLTTIHDLFDPRGDMGDTYCQICQGELEEDDNTVCEECQGDDAQE